MDFGRQCEAMGMSTNQVEWVNREEYVSDASPGTLTSGRMPLPLNEFGLLIFEINPLSDSAP